MLNFLKDTIARCKEKEAKLQAALINAETKEERQSLNDAIKIIDVLPQNEQSIQLRNNSNKLEAKEETFWQKLFKNFKCD